MATKKEAAVYTHGHHSSAVNDHARRGAKDSAGFLLPHIKSDFKILDVGCGPGSITMDFAELVPHGHVTGCDAVASVLEQAKANAITRGLINIDFQYVDANDLPFEDSSFDIVFCHQVLQHVRLPVNILKEMRRVAKADGGIVAAREADYSSFAWYPEPPLLNRWRELYIAVARKNGGEPNAGRYLYKWARDAGFRPDEIEATWACWRYAGERAKQFSQSHGGRILQPVFIEAANRAGLATKEDVTKVSGAWMEWGLEEDAFIMMPNSQILCRKGV